MHVYARVIGTDREDEDMETDCPYGENGWHIYKPVDKDRTEYECQLCGKVTKK